MKYDKKERLYTIEYVENDITEEERNSAKPEDITNIEKMLIMYLL